MSTYEFLKVLKKEKNKTKKRNIAIAIAFIVLFIAAIFICLFCFGIVAFNLFFIPTPNYSALIVLGTGIPLSAMTCKFYLDARNAVRNIVFWDSFYEEKIIDIENLLVNLDKTK